MNALASLASILLLPLAALAQAPQLFGPAPSAPADPLVGSSMALVTSRAVLPDLALLDGLGVGDRFVVDLLPGTPALTAEVERFQRDADVAATAWWGRFVDRPDSHFVLARCGEAVAGSFTPMDDSGLVLGLSPIPGGHALRGFASGVLSCEDGPAERAPARTAVDRIAAAVVARGGTNSQTHAPGPSGGVGHSTGGGCCNQDPRYPRVMWTATANALGEVGSAAGLQALATAGLLSANATLMSTRVDGFDVQIQSTGGVWPWLYVQGCRTPGEIRLDLARDTRVRAERERREADLVIAMLGDTGSNCMGSAYTSAEHGGSFSVILAAQAAGHSGHPLGHGFDADHQGNCSPQEDWNYAWQTICATGLRQTRMWRWLTSTTYAAYSTHKITPSGCFLPIGVRFCAENVRVIGNTRQRVANRMGAVQGRGTRFGAGWPGTQGVPRIYSARVEVGAVWDVEVANSLGAATVGGLFVGFGRASVPTPFGGTLLTTGDIVLGLQFPNEFEARRDIPLPADPQLCGSRLWAQGFVVDAGASQGIAFTQGLEATLGY